MGGSKSGFECAIVCLLVLGLVLEQVRAKGVDCGANPFKVACYHSCLLGPYGYRVLCADVCACAITASRAIETGSDEPNAIGYCSLGCRSSVCDNMVNTAAANSEEMTIYVKRCSDACDSFCKGDTRPASLDA